MQFKFLLAAAAAAALVLSLAAPAFAQEESLLTVEVSEETYTEGERIVISGNVRSVIIDTPIIMQIIYNEGNIIFVNQITPAEDGSFTETVLAQGPLWQNDGEYVVRASYGTANVSETSFQFVARQENPEIEEIFEVDAGSSGTFDVIYAIQGGSVSDMMIDPEVLSLITTIDSTNGGTLTLELPRESIDSRTGGCEGDDVDYIIIVDGIEVPPNQETGSTARDRVLVIDFGEESSSITVIGTCIVPEFGGMAAAAILAASVTAIVVLSGRTRLGSKSRIFP